MLVVKPVNDFLFVIPVTELFLLALTVEVLQGKTCQDLLLLGEGRSFGAKISGDGSSLGNICWFLQNQTHFAT